MNITRYRFSSSGNCGAFTLIELLVSIMILAILVALTAYGLKDIMLRSTSAGCLFNLRQIGVAAQSYMQDNNGWIAPFNDSSEYTDLWWGSQRDPLSPYLSKDGKPMTGPQDSPKYYMCPGEKASGIDMNFYNSFGGTSYAINVQLFYAPSGADGENYKRIKYMNVVSPSKTVYLGDGVLYAGGGGYYPDGGWQTSSFHGAANSHICNLLMLDGHAENVKMVSDPYGALWSGATPDSNGRLKWFKD